MALRPHVTPELLTNITKALGITAIEQWYYVSHHAATRVISSGTLNKFGGTLSSFLKHAYPQHPFDEEKLTQRNNKEKDQKFIEVVIRQLFPNTEILTKARKSVGIINPETDAYLEIDFWIPSLKLGIEYQDKHHYVFQWYANETLETYQKRDRVKKDAMSKLGYTLVTIGYWWDKSIESIAATIRKYRPDLLQEYECTIVEPVSSDPPHSYGASTTIPGVSGLMSPFIPNSNFNPIDWYGGEKHDGIRGVYNPELNKVFSRSGNELSIFPCLLKDIPSILIEGEIVAGRGNYNKTAAVSYHTHHDKVNWPMFRYVVFDIPDAEIGNYVDRYTAIVTGLLARAFIFSQLAFRVLLINKAHLKLLVDATISDHGEGVIAQQDATYEYGRATGLAKIKVRRDADAQVLHISKLSCTCKLISGAIADIAIRDDFYMSDLKVGDIISYYHDGYSQSGFPKRAEIYKVRYDIKWEDLIDNNLRNSKLKSVKEATGSKSLIARDSARNKLGHWNKPLNVRSFFDEFARTSGFEPLVAANWYPVRYSTLRNAGGGGLLGAYNFNVNNALSQAYPELKFETVKFITHQVKVKNKHWNSAANARAFFDEFARTEGFDSLIPENWYSVTVRTLLNAGGGGLLGAHDNILKNALSFAYPEVDFDKQQFGLHSVNKRWDKPLNVRAFFNEFARTAGFDPLVSKNWNAVKHSSLQRASGSGLLQAYGYDFKKALSFAYPELKFET